MEKEYLGDSVYVALDDSEEGFTMFILTTENGVEIKNRIYLESDVAQALVRFINKPREEK